MRRIVVSAVAVAAAVTAAQAAGPHHNPMIDLLAKKQPVFGLYAPSNGRRSGGPQKTPDELAQAALAIPTSDFTFDGSMEGSVERGLPGFSAYALALSANGLIAKTPSPHMTQAIVVKTQEIGKDFDGATTRIGSQLNAGVNTLVFVGAESAAEVEAGLKAMRFRAKGGTRADAVGDAPKVWGLSESDYKKKADLWPLNQDGELVNWTIVESKEGLAHVDEIAAVKGIGVLLPGAGTLRQVFSEPKIGADGKQEVGPNGRGVTVLNQEAWEAAIQKVLAACKKYDVPCGYPSNTAEDMQARYAQGFRVFIAGWGDAGTKMTEAGRALRK